MVNNELFYRKKSLGMKIKLYDIINIFYENWSFMLKNIMVNISKEKDIWKNNFNLICSIFIKWLDVLIN